MTWEPLPPEVRSYFNSAFPYGFNDGPVWAGRGVTTAVTAGLAARIGMLSLQIEPMFFAAQNSAFALMNNGQTGQLAYADGLRPRNIDQPQRFGDARYARFDLGQSTLRLDLDFIAAGVSTANDFWGPAIEQPILLGNNAAGFAHAFAGTARPIDVYIGTIHGRVEWGRLDQSAYSSAPDSVAKRFMAGAVAVFMPRGIPGLEIGAGRFFHLEWPTGGFLHGPFLKPFEAVLKQQIKRGDNTTGKASPGNQLASVFARWAFPSSGVEVYGEFGREDYNLNLRDLWQEPDHDSAYLLGLQRVWTQSNERYFVFRGEILNSRISHLYQAAMQGVWYVHTVFVQGHTERGQVLGSAGAYGGGASELALDRYSPGGRWTVRWGRLMRAEDLRNYSVPASSSPDVVHTLGFERLIFFRQADVTAGATGVWDLNRNWQRDAFDLNLTLAMRRRW